MKFQTDLGPRKKDPGKEVEAAVQGWLEAESAATPGFAYHRYPDARAARGALSAQPADFLVARKFCGVRQTWHVEAKDTMQERRLPKAKVRQYGKLKLFWLAGIEPVVIIRRSTLNDWVCLTSVEMFSFDECPPSFSLADLTPYPTLNDLMTRIFK